MRFFCFLLFVLFLAPARQAESREPIYVALYKDNQIFAVDPVTGSVTLAATIPGNPGPDGLDSYDKTTLYAACGKLTNVYRVNLQTGESSIVNNAPIGNSGGGIGLSDIKLLNASTALVTQQFDNQLYFLNLQTGASTLVANIPAGSDTSSVDERNGIAYVTGYNSNKIFAVDLQTGSVSTAATLPGGAFLYGIVLGSGSTAYVTDGFSDIVYAGDLQTGIFSPLTTISGDPLLAHIALENGESAYTEGGTDNKVYAINLSTGANSVVTPTAIAAPSPNIGLFGIFIWPRIPTAGLSGNNQTLAAYINDNAPKDTVSLFMFLNGQQLDQALESTAPTRNAFSTFAAQNGYLASGQALADHLTHRHLLRSQTRGAEIASADELLAANSGVETTFFPFNLWKKKEKTPPPSPAARSRFSVWGSLLGEYAHEKAQQQTPAFSALLGGAIAAVDCNCASGHLFGFGGAYVFTHLDEKHGAGHADVQQGFLTAYGSLKGAQCYLDGALWGGYYHTDNTRNVVLPGFPGFNQTAKSDTDGWQFASHLEVGRLSFLHGDTRIKRIGLDPFVSGDWVANWEAGFKEHGASLLNMQQKGRFCSLLRVEAGLRMNEILEIHWGRIFFQEKGSYAYQKMFNTGAVTAFLVGSPGSFLATTLTSPQHLGVVEFSTLFTPWSGSYAIDLGYQGEFGSLYQSHQGMLMFTKTF